MVERKKRRCTVPERGELWVKGRKEGIKRGERGGEREGVREKNRWMVKEGWLMKGTKRERIRGKRMGHGRMGCSGLF